MSWGTKDLLTQQIIGSRNTYISGCQTTEILSAALIATCSYQPVEPLEMRGYKGLGPRVWGMAVPNKNSSRATIRNCHIFTRTTLISVPTHLSCFKMSASAGSNLFASAVETCFWSRNRGPLMISLICSLTPRCFGCSVSSDWGSFNKKEQSWQAVGSRTGLHHVMLGSTFLVCHQKK